MAIIKQLEIKKPINDLDEETDMKIRKLCMEKGLTFYAARDKICARRKLKIAA